MTEEEEGRHIVSPFKPQSFEHEQVQQLISICQSGQLSAEIELELRVEILAVIIQLMEIEESENPEDNKKEPL
jgi:hypothetical protein